MSNKEKILAITFLGAAKRSQFARMFTEYLASSEYIFRIRSVELDVKNYPISKYAEVTSGPDFNNAKEFEKFSHEQLEGEDLVIPFMDSASLAMSKLKADSGDDNGWASFVCCSLNFSDFVRDKRKFKSIDLKGEIQHIPFDHNAGKKIVKPRFGFGGKGIRVIEMESLENEIHEDYIIENYIDGFETSIDAFFSKNGNLIQSVSRSRLEINSGEVTRTRTFETTPNQTELLQNFSRLGAIGPINVQTITNADGIEYVMEVNARLGGGSTASIASGLNFVEMICDEWITHVPAKHYQTRPIEVVRAYEDFVWEIG